MVLLVKLCVIYTMQALNRKGQFIDIRNVSYDVSIVTPLVLLAESGT